MLRRRGSSYESNKSAIGLKLGSSCDSNRLRTIHRSPFTVHQGSAMLIPVILSGGSGTRLWPLSRELYPKQLLPLVGKGTMLQETLARLSGVEHVAEPIVVCNESHRFLVAEQLLEAGAKPQAILLEPCGRNTAPAVAIAAMAAVTQAQPSQSKSSDPVLLIL